MITSSKGMVQVSGTTYRIVQRAELHEVVRVFDDQLMGAFRHHPTLRIVDSRISPEAMLEIAKQALRSARLAWVPNGIGRPTRLGVCIQAIATRWNHLVATIGSLFAGSVRLQPVVVLSRSRRMGEAVRTRA